jgi:3-deoxy-alpha-D-manno-octulosonate 8-oxidase
MIVQSMLAGIFVKEFIMLTDFVNSPPWWRTPVTTEIILSACGVGDLLERLKNKRAFIIIDSALATQDVFKPLCALENTRLFDASASEPKTGDVDNLVQLIKTNKLQPEVIVGAGGGGAMDLAKAVGICLTNPEPAAFYQGWGFALTPGIEVWTVPTLSGTGAELTPIAVLRGPEKKLGINSPLVAPKLTIVDPQLPNNAPACRRFYCMMDCFYHHYEVSRSQTSAPDAIADAVNGLALAHEVLSNTEYNLDMAIKAARASILGGSSTVGGRVGGNHAISYGLSNASPTLPHSVAVTISMLALQSIYAEGWKRTMEYLRIKQMPIPRAADFGVHAGHIAMMVKVAINMDKLWLSQFGDGWEKIVTTGFLEDIYTRIVNA